MKGNGVILQLTQDRRYPVLLLEEVEPWQSKLLVLCIFNMQSVCVMQSK